MILLETTRNYLRQNPTTFALIGRRGENDKFDRRVLRRSDDLLIEGFPRSGNTFGTMAFRLAQSGPLNIGNHFHAPAQVALARRYGIPALVVYREPMAAALSLVVYTQGRMSPAQALGRYIAFHQPILKHPDAFIATNFTEVIANFGHAIDRLNTRFGTTFSRYENTPENDAVTKLRIEEKRLKRVTSDDASASSLARQTTPSAHKDMLKSQFRAGFDTPKCKNLLQQAQDLFFEMDAL